MGWKIYSGQVIGTKASGDRTVPPTTRWNVKRLIATVWKKVSIFEVPADTEEYYVGFVPHKGSAQIREEPVRAPRFAMKNGFEDCTFFALDAKGKEIPLRLIGQSVKDRLPEKIPLL